ncbi:MAG: hypothetical protein EA381_14615 [Planctomycetaceae bacterium]|nr:MAG: hypothetical protein EA381_14615 [Planctomycetaceae bacterium]
MRFVFRQRQFLLENFRVFFHEGVAAGRSWRRLLRLRLFLGRREPVYKRTLPDRSRLHGWAVAMIGRKAGGSAGQTEFDSQ